jgi:NitT/TauT family transport system permease protein
MNMQRTFPKSLSDSTPPGSRSLARYRGLRQFAPVAAVLLVLLVWQVATWIEVYPSFILPPPAQVVAKWGAVLADGSLLPHALATFTNVILGLLIGVGIALIIGYWVAKSRLLEEALTPIIITVQSTPVVAYAPLLIILLGNGAASKIVVAALTVFFPMLMNVIVGIRTVPEDERELMRTLNATRWQTLLKLELPAALPIIISGLKISATLAVIGAVVGEFVGANIGLGYLINLARSQYDNSLVIVAVLTLTILARLLYGLMSLLEHILLRRRDRSPRLS